MSFYVLRILKELQKSKFGKKKKKWNVKELVTELKYYLNKDVRGNYVTAVLKFKVVTFWYIPELTYIRKFYEIE